jgi:hypothetical protein
VCAQQRPEGNLGAVVAVARVLGAFFLFVVGRGGRTRRRTKEEFFAFQLGFDVESLMGN